VLIGGKEKAFGPQNIRRAASRETRADNTELVQGESEKQKGREGKRVAKKGGWNVKKESRRTGGKCVERGPIS